jgi:hypothetical protein
MKVRATSIFHAEPNFEPVTFVRTLQLGLLFQKPRKSEFLRETKTILRPH